MAEQFQTSPQNITLHSKALYGEGEIAQQATCKEFLQVRQEGPHQNSLYAGFATSATRRIPKAPHTFMMVSNCGCDEARRAL